MEQSPFRLLAEITESLTQASGSAGQLIHLYGNPVGFMMIRDALDLAKEGCMMLAKQNRILS